MIQIPTYQHHLANGVSFPPLPDLSPSFVSDGAVLTAYETENMSFSNFSPPIDADRSLSNVFSLLNLSPETCAGGKIGSSFSGEGFVHPVNSLGVNDYVNRQRERWSEDMADLQRHCAAIADNRLKFQKLDDYEHHIPCCSFFQSQSESQSQNHQFMSPWCLKKLRGRIYTMAKDQNGCRILQYLFERPTIEEVEIVLSEVVDFISDLMKDQFGNYLVQKLVVLCNDEQKLQLLRSLIKDIVLVCVNPHGTRAVQKLLENLQDPNQVKLVIRALHRGATTLATDPNGHHVIQYCLAHFRTDINMPILTEIADECYKIATDRSGCCVLQACVEHARGEVRTRIIAEIMTNSVHLAEDPFGNYVLQHMVGLNVPDLTALLVRQLQGNFASLSCNKYGSNVVEKCLNESGEEISTRIVLELIRSPNSSLLLVDPYANFVIQSALKVSKGYAHECLCGLISKNMWSMQTNLYGKKILGRFNKKKVNFA
ncbi:hypothetical protein L1987_48251 [Smallanthus sonchifolius]|uniref:Uncharacterized protein n=1 Tax=Smallanthus sonchifolius TaxID=185202 RepID=A0ACB9FRX8_9ASTR|nr:hypothetical protein L1987_48251 [Smallanthus sonchifolius]